MPKCFICDEELVYDEITGRWVCPDCGNTQKTVYNQGQPVAEQQQNK
jgi:predicted RNA-binding Zn-ribbon protein involved in translation (DUF1610 family)